MKLSLKLGFLSVLLFFYSCGSGPGHTAVQVPDGNTVILVGTMGFASLRTAPFSEWFEPAYTAFTPDPANVETIKPLLEDVEILVFLGTWCEDTQREIPKFVKILEATRYPLEAVEVIAMTRDKTTPQDYEAGLDITNIPTMIFYKDGVELGRIVEFAVEDLESDMIKVLSGQPYKHAYDWD
ncbi:thioredoxin family protein [Robiginitalea sp.]|uniref:thioredoxin family protein n=1 Tax=Robiginitalea sp. TaxID=1902411 RepID=UPI003C764C93